MRRVVVLGDVVTDVTARVAEPITIGSDARAEIATGGGGGGANVAAWLAALSCPVTLVARVGDDALGRTRTVELREAGVDVRVAVDPRRATGAVIVIVTPDGERTMLPDRGANLGLEDDDLPETLFVAGDHLHVSGYALFDDGPRPAARRALARAREVGMTTSVDVASVAPLQRVGPAAFLEWTARVDLCRANAQEARTLAGVSDEVSACQALGRRYTEAVVTTGREGALWSDGAEVVAAPARVTEVQDTTGAGDAFTAGYLAAWLAGTPPAGRLAAGHRVAAAAVGTPGARPGDQRLAERLY